MDAQSNCGKLPLFNLLSEKTNHITKMFFIFIHLFISISECFFITVIKAHKRMLAWFSRN